MFSTQTPTPPGNPPPVTPSRTRRWRRRGLEAVLVLVLIVVVRAWQQGGVASGPAPALAGVLLDGKSCTLASAPGQPVLVHFWATWCPICRAEQGGIAALARDHPTITVAMQSGGREAVAEHMQKESLSFPVLNDPDGTLAAQWGVRAVPASFIVDGAGRIRFVEVGYTTGVGLRIRLWLARVWASNPAGPAP